MFISFPRARKLGFALMALIATLTSILAARALASEPVGQPSKPVSHPGRMTFSYGHLDRGAAPAPAQKLDLYLEGIPRSGKAPIVLFVHGGGWSAGDKLSGAGQKPAFFNRNGIVFVSMNYRLVPEARPTQQAEDVAAALAWLRREAPQYGGDADRIFLMGHSAGAHLAALAALNDNLLATEFLAREHVRGVVLLDGAGYDIARQMAASTGQSRLRDVYSQAFGEAPEYWKAASPVTYVAGTSTPPPFLVFAIARRADSVAQSHDLVALLQKAGGKAQFVAVPQKTHVQINRDFGEQGDAVSETALRFISGLR